MYSQEILDLVMKQNGTLSQSQFIDIYDNTPQLQCVLFDEMSFYKYEMWLEDKIESIFFNINKG